MVRDLVINLEPPTIQEVSAHPLQVADLSEASQTADVVVSEANRIEALAPSEEITLQEVVLLSDAMIRTEDAALQVAVLPQLGVASEVDNGSYHKFSQKPLTTFWNLETICLALRTRLPVHFSGTLLTFTAPLSLDLESTAINQFGVLSRQLRHKIPNPSLLPNPLPTELHQRTT
jgi:hypothetical protein